VKIARTIGLAVLAAMALMASMGAGSAVGAPTALCENDLVSPYCLKGDAYPAKTVLKAKATDFKLVTSLATVVCGISTMEVELSAESGEPLPVSIPEWTFGNCKTSSGAKCEMEPDEGAPTTASLNQTTSGIGSLTFGKALGGLWVGCGATIDCVFEYPSFKVDPLIRVQEQTFNRLTGFCPVKATLSATYSIDSPAGAYVAVNESPPPGLTFCRAKLAQEFCTGSDLYPAGTAFEAKASSLKIDNSIGTIACTGASLKGETVVVSADPLPIDMSSFDLSGCEFKGFGGKCDVTSTDLSPSEIFTGGFSPLILEIDVTLLFQCGANFHCSLRYFGGHAFKDSASWLGEGAGGFKAESLAIETAGGICPSLNKLTATYEVTSPDPLYVMEGY
jgi:hypothetical protein